MKKLFLKNILRSKKGVTMMELIIASIVSIIVLTSLASIDYSVRLMHQNAGSESMLSVETTAILQHISRNLLLATGDANDSGIIISGGNAMSILQDQNTPPTPGDYTDDTWVYYWLNNNSIEFCEGQGTCSNLLTSLGSGSIATFNIVSQSSSDQADLDNQVQIEVCASVDPTTCTPADFTTSTLISLPSHGGPTI